ncbi:Putative flagellin protein [Salinisphaera shabanensis E1L3A]|uniref:Flagellin n=1 Tax=Salinisphaera shabanensis E1L3A TaxID=1033802 RepID=U2E1J5_9GAMM|nr:flagellin [Salinisphaera shabanensis]ERJ17786.1 Putative flagellin protein [Salinisphaera shabanensis E1L3A]
MSFVINTNTLSLTAQQNLNQSQKTLNSAIERLSSGSKINSAKDDAAGQAISNRMTSQINGLKQASSNANDGISLAQTTEGALNQINDNLQRVRELTVQAANGTNSQSDLESIQGEIEQRLGEIDRVSEQTAFNGTKVLDGSKTEIKIQVGDKDDQTISINLANMDSASLNLDGFNVDGTTSVAVGDATTLNLQSYNDADGNTQYVINDGSGGFTQAEINSETGVVSDTGIDATTAVTDAGGATNIADGGTVTVETSDPLAALDSALKQVDDLRSDLGAVQNRLDSAINNISTTEINISSARSRITDADYATEVSNMSKAQILQQAGTSVLAQANQSTQGVLSLLR